MLHILFFYFRSRQAKTILKLSGGPKYVGGFPKGKGNKFIGSSDYGYPLSGNFGSSFGESLDGSNMMYLDSNNVFDEAQGSNFASASNVVRLIANGPQRFFRRPQRYIITTNGGRIPRNADLQWTQKPVRQLEHKVNTGPKKPIPVGERFRLP